MALATYMVRISLGVARVPVSGQENLASVRRLSKMGTRGTGIRFLMTGTAVVPTVPKSHLLVRGASLSQGIESPSSSM